MTREYFNRMAAKWDDCVAEKDAAKLEGLAESLDILPGETVLDVGAGTGVFAPYLLRKIGSHGRLVCLDEAEEMLQKAREKKLAGNIEYVRADIAGSRLESGIFDAVVCYSSFPHFSDKPLALKEIFRMLKPGGKLFICHTSSRQTINHIHSQIPEVRGHLIPEEDLMRRWLSAAGFAGISVIDSSDRYLVEALKDS
ncbi:MAG: class I SAM-dependent methyltransferase [Dehalococcoidales bacterium]|nr:class I SAM-dependent methyltransferase [Dehalococcoidales bacterium]